MTKRASDISLALLFVIPALPVMVVFGALVALAFRTQPLFFQERVGFRGERFRMVKLRTLPPGTPIDLDKYAVAQIELPAVAAFLRRTHLDELPQLFLVLTGKMTLVGPRPELPRLHAALPQDFARLRTTVRPGCTGLWQIGRDCVRMIGEACEYDLAYLRHRSWRLDLWVLVQTARQMLLGWRSLGLDDVPRWALQTEIAGTVTAAPVHSAAA